MIDNVLPLDTFVVINHTMLNDTDRKSLVLLYQPVIGSVATNLYLTLWSFINNDEVNHYDLVNSMQLKLEEICIAREKLEAIGLLKTYYKKGKVNEYIYELYAPLDPYEFINNPVLDTALFNNVGATVYNKIINQYSLPKVNLEQYTEISKSFKDVFSFIESNRINSNNIIKVKHLGLDFEPTIDLKEILSLIPEDLINYRSITGEVRTLIYQLALIYNLDNDSMRDIIENSLGVDKKLDIEALKNNCRNYYKFENKGKVPAIVYRNQPLAWRSNTNGRSKLDLMIKDFEETTPYEFLKSRNGDTEPTPNDLKILEYLLIEQKLKPGVVNVLIDYVLKINKNKLVKPFVEQIATQWSRSNINMVADAIEFAKSENNSKPTKQPKTKAKKLPTWLDSEIEAELMSEEELKAFEKELEVIK